MESVTDVDERFLAALGIVRIPVPVPYVEAGGPVNAYALLNDDGTWTLFDTGLGTPEGMAALRRGAHEAQVDLRRVTRIIVSHGHVDHFGNAQQLSEESGAPVFIHPADLAKFLGEAGPAAVLTRHRSYFLALGAPPDVLDQMLEAARLYSSNARALEPARLAFLEDGQPFRFRHFDAVVRHFPGHTPGLVCLHLPSQRILFADDHVLAKVSPNPLLDFSQGEGDTKFLALVRYLEGAKAVREMELDCVLPGHGSAFAGHRPLLDALFDFYRSRQAKLLRRLQAEPLALNTVYELVGVLFPRRDLSRLVLMLSEVLANLEVLEVEGKVSRESVGGVFVFKAKDAALAVADRAV